MEKEEKTKENVAVLGLIIVLLLTVGIVMTFGSGLLFIKETDKINESFVPQYAQDRWKECEKLENLDLQRDCKEYYKIKSWLTQEEYFKSRETLSMNFFIVVFSLSFTLLGILIFFLGSLASFEFLKELT